MSTVATAIDHIGLTRLANRLGYYPSAVQKWKDADRLPMTELSGMTSYAAVIEEMSAGKYRATDLIAHTRAGWKQLPPAKRGPKSKRRKNGARRAAL